MASLKVIFASVILSAIVISCQANVENPRILVLLDNLAIKETHSIFFKNLGKNLFVTKILLETNFMPSFEYQKLLF